MSVGSSGFWMGISWAENLADLDGGISALWKVSEDLGIDGLEDPDVEGLGENVFIFTLQEVEKVISTSPLGVWTILWTWEF